MLTNSQIITIITMPQSRASSSIPVPVNGSVVPATASHSVHVNGSAVPAAASRPAHVQSIDDIAALMSNMSISKPTVVKPTSASSSRSHASKSSVATHSLANIAPSVNKASVYDRIAERRRRTTLPVKTSTTSSRVSPPTTATDTEPVLTSHKLSSPSPPAVATTIPVVPAATPEPAVAASAPQPDVAVVVPQPVSTTMPEPAIVSPTTNITDTVPVLTSQQPDVTAVVSDLVSTFVFKSTVPVASKTNIATIASAILSELAALIPPPLPDLIPITSEPINPSLIPKRRYGFIYTWLPGSYRQNEEDKWTFDHLTQRIRISDHFYDADSLIPSVATARRPRYQVPDRFREATIPFTETPIPDQITPVFMPHTTTRLPPHFEPVYVPTKPKEGRARGDSKYCSGRPRGEKGRGTHGYHALNKGRLCGCLEHEGADKWHVRPQKWGTTPAESGKDRWPKPKKSNKRVRWAQKIITIFPGEKPVDQCLPQVPLSSDPATREDDFPEGFCDTVK